MTVGQAIAVMDWLQEYGGLEQLRSDLEERGTVAALSGLLADGCVAACGGDATASNALVRECVHYLEAYLKAF